ncbi:MAG: membrane protein [Phycisphaerae bacterium]|nr:MAG: membrane protein [Phycisphaerae bacterium]
MTTMPQATTSAATAISPGGIENASPAQIAEWVRRGEAVIIDVREPDEHAREHIAGACLVPLSSFDPERAAARAKPGQMLVMHCRSGRRSADAAGRCATLTPKGWRLVNMTGGIEAWKQAGLPVEVNTAAPRMSLMRQVQLTIGVGVLAGCALAWFVHPWFIGLAAFFGAGLVFAGLSGTCGLAAVLARMPWNAHQGTGASCDRGTCA